MPEENRTIFNIKLKNELSNTKIQKRKGDVFITKTEEPTLWNISNNSKWSILETKM